VGRLDFNTEGVLLFTNDGDLAQALLHPRCKIAKVYHAKLKGEVALAQLERLRKGVMVEGKRTAPAEVFVLGETERNTWIEIRITEGRTHQVKLMGDAVGSQVLNLVRVNFAGLTVEGLRPGHTRPLTVAEVDALHKLAGGASYRQARRKRHR
jgi:23S rRNA pseudouridine2605 synthase